MVKKFEPSKKLKSVNNGDEAVVKVVYPQAKVIKLGNKFCIYKDKTCVLSLSTISSDYAWKKAARKVLRRS